jgi:hypothetical protein
MRVAMAAQKRRLRCRERGHRRGALRQTKLRLELYKQSRPQQAPSSGISPVGSSGTVPNLLAANSRNPRYPTQRPVRRDYAFHLLLGLGFGASATGGAPSEMASMRHSPTYASRER